jgi:xylulokinase
MHEPLLLGIDLGTTGCRAVLVTPDGTVVAAASSPYPLLTPHPLWAEQDPESWWVAAVDSVRRVLEARGAVPRSVAAVGLTGQMHGLVLLGTSGEVLRPAILWNDQRTELECAEIVRRVGVERVLELTGNPALPGFTAPKVLWVRRHEPELHDRIASVLLPKDFIRYRLTGERFSDVSDASGTTLFDVSRREWSAEMLEALEIPRAWLPEVTESPIVSSRVGSAAARETGLGEGTPVVAGAGDQAAQAVGAGIVDEGSVLITLGTSGVVFAASRRYRVHPTGSLHAFCHAVPGLWHLMGVMLSAGGSLGWYRATFAAAEEFETLLAEAAAAPAGSEGLIFLPYLSGERTPHADPHARGVLFGLTLRHTRPHVTRAILEGVAYGLADSLELMRELSIEPREIRLSGGGARSGLWRQILADTVGVTVAALEASEGAAYGAALLAGVGAGVYADVPTAARTVVRETGHLEPGPHVATYRRGRAVYRALYPALAGHFRALAP